MYSVTGEILLAFLSELCFVSFVTFFVVVVRGEQRFVSCEGLYMLLAPINCSQIFLCSDVPVIYTALEPANILQHCDCAT